MRPLNSFGILAAAALMTVGCAQDLETPVEDSAAQEASKPLVLVAGATGRTGSLVVAELQAQGYPVRAFVRDTAKAAERLGPDVEAVAGDLKDTASIAAALDGVGAVINAAGAGSRAGGDNTPEKVDYEGARQPGRSGSRGERGPLRAGVFKRSHRRRSSSEQDVQQRIDLEAQRRGGGCGQWSPLHDRTAWGLERRPGRIPDDRGSSRAISGPRESGSPGPTWRGFAFPHWSMTQRETRPLRFTQWTANHRRISPRNSPP